MTMDFSALDFVHQYKEQPHASRRIEILKKHPEIKKLMSANGDFHQVLMTAAVCLVHVLFAYISANLGLGICSKTLINLTIGSVTASWVFMNVHEAAHGLLFGPAHPKCNKLAGMLINLVYAVPVYSFFKKHHLDHHKYQGDVDFDVEYPSQLEIKLFNNQPVLRLLWLQMSGLLMQIRGYLMGPRKIDLDDIVNVVSVLTVDIWLCTSGRFWVFAYMIGGTFAATGMGLIGVWGLASHTVYFNEEDTMSYYGWLNPIFFNAGYHMEHHDFPNIPQRLLPEVNRIAPEFYKDQHRLDSFFSSVVKFMFDPNTGIHSRIKRSIPSLEKDKSKLH